MCLREKIILFISLLGPLLFFSSCSVVESITQKSINMKYVTERINSKNTGHSYTLYIYLPSNYSNTNDSYPTLYLLDGDSVHEDSSYIISKLIDSNTIPPIIVVAVGYGDGPNRRMTDYTPTVDPDGDGGGASKFFKFLTEELIPHIDSEYRTKTDPAFRCIAGHSLGGIAVLYALFFYYDTFANFIATSPSLWWDNEIFFSYESDFSQKAESINSTLRLFTSVGALEGMGMNVLLEEFVNRLKAPNYPFIKIFKEIIPHKRHWENRYIALKEGLKVIFRDIQ